VAGRRQAGVSAFLNILKYLGVSGSSGERERRLTRWWIGLNMAQSIARQIRTPYAGAACHMTARGNTVHDYLWHECGIENSP
jgi:hypothetical protein